MHYECNNELVIVDGILFNEVLWCNGIKCTVLWYVVFHKKVKQVRKTIMCKNMSWVEIESGRYPY